MREWGRIGSIGQTRSARQAAQSEGTARLWRDPTPEFQLFTEIINLSESATWEGARLEAALAEVYETEEPETCCYLGSTP